ncbi:MAG TPA: SMI1/KNR4 family protein [Flavobacteriales bacterium]|nr:SMI1/KNR4 family protein [Flavobacteriales bacterium]
MDWKKTLIEMGYLINTLIEENMIYYNKEDVKLDWLGYEGASDNEINRKEKSLGIFLPESYKKFLKISNGFRQISPFSGNLQPVSSINWLKFVSADFVQMHDESEDINVPDDKYFDYSENQRTEFYRAKYLKESIAISEWVDGSIILLNPMVQYGDECEAWIYANWYPGARRFRSFADLMMYELNWLRQKID